MSEASVLSPQYTASARCAGMQDRFMHGDLHPGILVLRVAEGFVCRVVGLRIVGIGFRVCVFWDQNQPASDTPQGCIDRNSCDVFIT